MCNKINDFNYGGYIQFKNDSVSKSTEIMTIFFKKKDVSESIRDVRWLVSVSRLPARAVVSWSCHVTTKLCPIIYCDENETQERLLINCYGRQEVWIFLSCLGRPFDLNYGPVMNGLINEKLKTAKMNYYN